MRKRISRVSILASLGVFALLLTVTTDVSARTDRFSIVPRYFALQDDGIVSAGSPVLERGQWHFSQFSDYGYHPLELSLGGRRARGIVDHLLIQQFGAGYGLSDRVTLEVSLPVAWWNRFTDPSAGVAMSNNEVKPGDLQIQGRYRFLDRDKDPMGLTAVSSLTLPTGAPAVFVGDNLPTGGLRLTVDKNLGQRFSIGVNSGLKFRERVSFMDLDTYSQFLAGATGSVKMGRGFTGKVELASATNLNEIYSKKVSSPTEFLSSVGKSVGRTGLDVSVGGGVAVVRAAGTPLAHGFIGVTYSGKAEGKSFRSSASRPRTWTLLFKKGSSLLDEQLKKILDEAASYALSKKKPPSVIYLEGDAAGAQRTKAIRALFDKRLAVIKKYLAGRGLAQLTYEVSVPASSGQTQDFRRIIIRMP